MTDRLSPRDRHRRARGAFLLLTERGRADVLDGPMFLGVRHGPWRRSDVEWVWTWERGSAVPLAEILHR